MITIEHTGTTSAVFRSREAQVIVRPGTRSYIEYSGMRDWVYKMKDMRIVAKAAEIVPEIVPEPMPEPVVEATPEPEAVVEAVPEPVSEEVIAEPVSEEVIADEAVTDEPVMTKSKRRGNK